VSKGESVSHVCQMMARSRQSYYKALKGQQRVRMHDQKLLELVSGIRQMMPRIGGRKLHFLLREKMLKNALKVGRDRFFNWLREKGLLVYPKRMYVHTTQSFHRFRIYDNLTSQMQLTAPNQLWVSDITYIRTLDGFCYLALITDAFSRKIVGYDTSDSLELQGCMRALNMAISTNREIKNLVHHSDRGIQYCSHQYTDLLKAQGIKISMAAKGNCYENALAERVNGILKNEFNLDLTFRSKYLATKAISESIYIYNQHRPHWALNLSTPKQCHAA
jgi:putative transposase